MNTINMFGDIQFPGSSETFDFLQQMVLMTAKLSSMGGTSYILSGCGKTGSNYVPGYMVINGEILSFDGGAAVSQGFPGGYTADYAVIVENKDSVQVYDQLFSNVYTRRKIVCGMGTGQFDIKTISNITNLVNLKTQLASLTTTVAGKAQANHTHVISGVTGLQDILDAKMNANAQIPASQVTGLPIGFLQKGIVGFGDVAYGAMEEQTVGLATPVDSYLIFLSYRDLNGSGLPIFSMTITDHTRSYFKLKVARMFNLPGTANIEVMWGIINY